MTISNDGLIWDNLKPGNWVRFYTNTTRQTTHLGQIRETLVFDGRVIGYVVDNDFVSFTAEVWATDVIQAWEDYEACKRAVMGGSVPL
jgi:hypothetical protein